MPLPPDAPFASIAEHGGDYFLHSQRPLARGQAAASPWVGKGAGRLFGVFTPQIPFASDAPPPPLVPASIIQTLPPQQKKISSPAPCPAPSEVSFNPPAPLRKLNNAGVIRRSPPVPPGVDLRTYAGQSFKSPLSGTTIQASCHRCSSTIFYRPECAQLTCCECSTLILSVECFACGSFFCARVGDLQSSCPHCQVSATTSNFMQRRVDSFMQTGPRATLLHPHEIHIISQVLASHQEPINFTHI